MILKLSKRSMKNLKLINHIVYIIGDMNARLEAFRDHENDMFGNVFGR